MRIAARLKLGYYPLPVEQGPKLRAMLSFPDEPTSALDPCCGTGAALHALTADANTELYGVELDANRAEAARASGITTLQGNAFDVRSRVERLSFLYLNPPYDFEVGPRANERMEKLFLGHTFSWLKPKGILLMVIPCKAVWDIVDTLTTRFREIAIYRLDGKESEQYDQCAVFGVRHNNNGNETLRFRQEVSRRMSYPKSLPVLSDVPDRMYAVPPTAPVEIYYAGLPLDEIEDRLCTSNAWRAAVPLLLPKPEVGGGTPLTPLHGGHVGLLATAGMLNGVFGEGDRRHIAHWRPVKHTSVCTEIEDGMEITRTKERFSNELAIVFATGETQVLTETAKTEPESEDVEVAKNSARSSRFEDTADDDEDDDDDDDDNGDGDDEWDEVKVAKVTRISAPAASGPFQLGRLVMTPGIQELIIEGLNVAPYLERYKRADWGDVDRESRNSNDYAVKTSDHILSAYPVFEAPEGQIYISTNADRSVTTILLPSEN
jgi:SAM-dependent methyltransferase